MASAKLLAPDAVKVENEIDSTEMEPLTKGVVLIRFTALGTYLQCISARKLITPT